MSEGTRAMRTNDVPRRARRACASAMLLSLGACQYLQFLPFLKRPVDPSARGWSETKRYGDADAPAGDGVAAHGAPSTDWPLYNGSYDGRRHSPLAQITSANVAQLGVVCRVPLEKHAAMQSGPVVVRGVAYVTSAVNTWAIDATTCRTKWRHTYRYDPKPEWDLKVNRGVAYAETPDGAVLVRGANDGRVYALDARTGEERWNVLAGDVKKGETFPAAPIAWRGLVYIGNAGGDNYGVTGRMMAFDVRTGRRVWSFDLVPGTGPANETWPAVSDSVPRAGGTTWTSYTLDTLAGLLYVPTGNAAPDFLSAVREGANQHTYSVVVLDARTGELRQAHQLLPGDFHDWDVAAAPLLVRTTSGRSLVAVAGKDGHLYGLEGEQGTRRYTTAVTTIENADAPLTRAGTRFCPGVQGGVEWNGPSFDPETNLLVVGAVDWCTTVRLEAPAKLEGKRGLPWTGSLKLIEPFGKNDPKAKARGWITAVDADDGTVRWKHQMPTPIVAAVTTTAGGVVFAADLAGRLHAYDTRSGDERFTFDAGQPIGGGIVSYEVGGRQYVAVAAGLHAPVTWQVKSGPPASLIVFALRP